MTTATTEGRRLVLAVEGIDEKFYVDPLAAKRGKFLTEQFIRASLNQLTVNESEGIFIECLGAANYSRISGYYIDQYDDAGNYVQTWHPGGSFVAEQREPLEGEALPAKYVAREARGDEAPLEGEPIRQEEAEALSLAAFYWQTVVGMEAVEAFFSEGGGTKGSLKALGLLQIRLGLSRPGSSSSPVTESLIQAATSKATPAISNSSASVRLPANKRGFLQNPSKSRKRR